jgi:hypothetical protein
MRIMNDASANTTVLICCGVFQAEVEALRDMHWPGLPIRFQNSMLHMRPEKLATRLDAVLDKELAEGRRVALIYGDCCGQIAALESRPGVTRTCGNNCCDMLLGRDEYRRLAHEGAFFLFPEWTHRWRQIFRTELGLNHENATDLMRDMHRKLVYLDTGLRPAPVEALQECAQFCGLPFEVFPVSLEPLRIAIQNALNTIVPI